MIAHNLEVIPKDKLAQTIPHDNDSIEILGFFAGG